MRLALASDVHLEFGPLVLENTSGADVLILSGDICVAHDLQELSSPSFEYGHAGNMFHKSMKIHDFFQNCCKKFADVVYVVGNHEHYHYDFQYTVKDLRKRLGYLPNLHILEKGTFSIGDVTFIGGTLWTDMNKEDPLTLWHISKAMNDFRCVKNSANQVGFWVENDGKRERKYRDSLFSPEDAVKEHRAMVDYIRIVTEGKYDQKFVVVGHHAPSRLSTHPRYKDEALMNGGYSSDLNEFILQRPQIKLWTHGHTHEDFDYMIGTTRVVCNPRGYINYENRADNFALKYLEV